MFPWFRAVPPFVAIAFTISHAHDAASMSPGATLPIDDFQPVISLEPGLLDNLLGIIDGVQGSLLFLGPLPLVAQSHDPLVRSRQLLCCVLVDVSPSIASQPLHHWFIALLRGCLFLTKAHLSLIVLTPMSSSVHVCSYSIFSAATAAMVASASVESCSSCSSSSGYCRSASTAGCTLPCLPITREQ